MPGLVVPAQDDTDWAVRIVAPRAAAFTRRYFMRDVSHEAVGLAGTRQRTDAVVTHGLPKSTDPDRAAWAAARTGLDALDGQPGGDPVAAIRRAYDRAADEIRDTLAGMRGHPTGVRSARACSAGSSRTRREPPGSRSASCARRAAPPSPTDGWATAGCTGFPGAARRNC